MAVLQKDNVVKIKNSPYEIESLKKQGFVVIDDPVVEKPVEAPAPKVEKPVEKKADKGGEKS